MSVLRFLLLAVVTAGAVLATDIAFRSTLLRTFWPQVLTPADGAIVTPPITVQWDGPQRLAITLTTSGLRQDLGEHDSPFEISTDRFPRSGQYSLELRSPVLGAWSRTERRFLVQLLEAVPEPTPCEDRRADIEVLQGTVARLDAERSEALAEVASLRETTERLRTENAELAANIDELEAVGDQADEMQELLEEQKEDLLQQQRALFEENRLLKSQIENVPPCTAWGYLTYPRPQTLPPTRRLVVVSDSRGLIFQSQVQCEITRRVDRGAASPCVCVGQTWH